MSYLLDSDWVIDALAGIRSAVEVLDAHIDEGVAISIIAVGEIFEGAYEFPDAELQLDRFREFLSAYRVIGLDEAVMELFARTRHSLRRQGQIIPDFDILIAATAIHHHLTLLTRNTRHFARIPELKLYQAS